MKQESLYHPRYSCGVHVAGTGSMVRSRGNVPFPLGTKCIFEQGVITMMPGKDGDPYTVLDVRSSIVVESLENELRCTE